MKSYASRVLIASLISLFASTTGCEAPVDQSDSDIRALPAKGNVQTYCAHGTGTIIEPDDAHTNVLSLNSLLEFAHEYGDVTLEECDATQAAAWEKPLVAGLPERLGKLWGWVLRWGGRAEEAAPLTGRVFRGAEAAAEIAPAIASARPLLNFSATLKSLGLKVGDVVRVGDRTGVTVIDPLGRTAKLVFSSKDKTIVEVHNHFVDLRYNQALVTSTLKGIRVQNAPYLKDTTLLVDVVKVGPNLIATGKLEKLLPIRANEYIKEMQMSVYCTTPADVQRALSWMVKLRPATAP
jgi:hypothetical protein